MFSSSRSSAGLATLAISALVLLGCAPAEDALPEQPEGVEEDDTTTPSNEPSAENPQSADDVDVAVDVALQAVNTGLNQEEGVAVGFEKDTGDEAGMAVDVAVGDGDLRTIITNQEGTSHVETLDGESGDDIQDLAEQAQVPLLKAMEIARTESAGLILGAQLEAREGDLITWDITIEGPATENHVIIDARNGAIVPVGDNPVEDNNIGGDPDSEDGDAEDEG